MKPAIVSAIQAFISQAKSNHLEYCKNYVKKHENETTVVVVKEKKK